MAVVTGLVLMIGVFGWMLLRPSVDDGGGSASTATTAPRAVPGEVLHPRGAAGPKAHKARSGRNAASSSASGFAGAPGDATAGWPGLLGHGYLSSIPTLHLVITVHSEAPIGTVGYIIPTSPDHAYGKVDGVGRTWRVSTRVYGKPDYARLWLQAGATGTPITCTITVDGRVTDRRTTKGPYGAVMCQG